MNTFLIFLLICVFVCLIGASVWWSFNLQSAAVISCLTGFVLFTSAGMCLIFRDAYGIETVFSAPFMALLDIKTTFVVMQTVGMPLLMLLLAGALLVGLPLRRVITQAIINESRAQARAELDDVRQKQEREHANALCDVKAQRTEAERLANAATEAIQANKQHQTALTKRTIELAQRERELNALEAKLNTMRDEYNAALGAQDRAEAELRRQLEIVNNSNLRLKGLEGRLMAYRDAWKALGKEATEELEERMNAIIRSIRQSRKKTGLSSHEPRPEVPQLQRL